jgi:hypothetical protein
MDWSAQVDGYCERVDFSFWAEPVNAVSNGAFILAALILWPRTKGLPLARALTAIIFIIGVGSFLFHTFATRWAAVADVLPIGVFILTYLFAINRDAVRLPLWAALLGTALFVPYAAITVPLINRVPFLAISNFYWTVPLLILIYAAVLARRLPRLAGGMAAGAVLLCVSITLRSLDMQVCGTWPVGTHFAWHLLNATMLGWMVHVYATHMVAGARRSE